MSFQVLVPSVAAAMLVAVASSARAQTPAKPATQSAAKSAPKPSAAKPPAHAHKAFAAAAKIPAELLKGIKLTAAERKTVNDIEKKYRDQIADAKKAHMAADKTGSETDAQITAKIQAIVDQEKTDLRAALTAAQQATFDKNAAKVKPL
jgi:hypothetical protein